VVIASVSAVVAVEGVVVVGVVAGGGVLVAEPGTVVMGGRV
jgi:hypothetical protein